MKYFDGATAKLAFDNNLDIVNDGLGRFDDGLPYPDIDSALTAYFPFDNSLQSIELRPVYIPPPDTIYAVDLTVYISGPGLVKKYYATHGLYFDSGAGVNYYEPRLKQPGNFQQQVFSNGTTGGASQTGYGEIVLLNPDGGLDAFINYGFDGRPIVLRKIIAGVATILMSCSMEQPTSTWDTLPIRIKDKQQLFGVAIQPVKYAGSNALPAGIEGTGDIKGQPKPLLFGLVSNATPVCVNTSRLIYQGHDGVLQDIPAVYDKGVALVRGADYASAADIQASDPAPGTYRAYLAAGMFRLGSSPVGQVTFDGIGLTGGKSFSAAHIAERIALRGISSGEIDAADVSALNTANSAVIGIYIKDESTLATALDEVLNSVGAWYGFDSLGVLNMGRLEAPAGTPIATLTTAEILEIERLATNDPGRGVPPYKVNLNYGKNYTVQGVDAVGGVISNQNPYWETVTMPQNGLWGKMAYGAGLYLAPMGGGTKKVAMSHDGQVWFNVTDLPYNVTIPSVAYGAGLWVVTDNTNGYIFTTPDGITWTQRTHGLGGIIDITFGGDTFIALSGIGIGVATSTTGTAWTTYATLPAGANQSVTWGERDGIGCFLAVKGGSGNVFATSTDKGATWTPRTAPSTTIWGNASSGKGVFIVLSNTYDDYRVAISKDNGATWTQRILKPGTGLGLIDSVYGNNMFLIAGGPSYTTINGDDWTGFPLAYGYLTYGLNQYISASGSSSSTIEVYTERLPTPRGVYLSKQYRTVTVSDPAILTKHPTAGELNINTLMTAVSAATTEATRILNLRKVDRDFLSVKVPSTILPADLLGRVINITIPRYGYDAGKLFVIMGATYDYELGTTTLQLWG